MDTWFATKKDIMEMSKKEMEKVIKKMNSDGEYITIRMSNFNNYIVLYDVRSMSVTEYDNYLQNGGIWTYMKKNVLKKLLDL